MLPIVFDNLQGYVCCNDEGNNNTLRIYKLFITLHSIPKDDMYNLCKYVLRIHIATMTGILGREDSVIQ